jgi:molybdopterin-containing oxidoreductase family iron-sulfur binding subunit
MVRYGMVIDLSRCMGCRACVEACKVENNTPQGVFWMWVFRFEEGEYPNTKIRFLPRPCMHCDNAPCVKVCPVGARFKREDGIVLTDFERCIGCRYCEVSCPYGVNYFNWKKPSKNQYFAWEEGEGDNVYGSGTVRKYSKSQIPPYKNPDHNKKYGGRLVSGGGHFIGVMEKCTFCVHRIEKGLKPACVANCPVNVYSFGDLDDPNSDASKVLHKKAHFRLQEELGTEPKVCYIGTPPAPRERWRLLDAMRMEVKP